MCVCSRVYIRIQFYVSNAITLESCAPWHSIISMIFRQKERRSRKKEQSRASWWNRISLMTQTDECGSQPDIAYVLWFHKSVENMIIIEVLINLSSKHADGIKVEHLNMNYRIFTLLSVAPLFLTREIRMKKFFRPLHRHRHRLYCGFAKCAHQQNRGKNCNRLKWERLSHISVGEWKLH